MEKIRIAEKYTLTISEACEYFNIGDKKLRKLIDENKSAEYIMTNGWRISGIINLHLKEGAVKNFDYMEVK